MRELAALFHPLKIFDQRGKKCLRNLDHKRRCLLINLRCPKADGQPDKIRRHALHVFGHKHFQIRSQIPFDILKDIRCEIAAPFFLFHAVQYNIFFALELAKQRTFIHACQLCNILCRHGDVSLISHKGHRCIYDFLTGFIHTNAPPS